MKFMLKQLLRSLSFFFNRRHRKPPGRENRHQIHRGTKTVFADMQLQDKVSLNSLSRQKNPTAFRAVY